MCNFTIKSRIKYIKLKTKMNLASLVIHCDRRYKSTGKLYSIIIIMSASSLMNRSVSRLGVFNPVNLSMPPTTNILGCYSKCSG